MRVQMQSNAHNILIHNAGKRMSTHSSCSVTGMQTLSKGLCRFAAQLEEMLKAEDVKGFDLALDAVSGEYFMAGFNALAPGGRYVIYGASNWTPSGERIKKDGCTLNLAY